MSVWCGFFQDTETSAAASFVPTVTAISTSPELKWIVQPTVITSASPSPCRAKPKTHAATQSSSRPGANKARASNRKGPKEQVKRREGWAVMLMCQSTTSQSISQYSEQKSTLPRSPHHPQPPRFHSLSLMWKLRYRDILAGRDAINCFFSFPVVGK